MASRTFSAEARGARVAPTQTHPLANGDSHERRSLSPTPESGRTGRYAQIVRLSKKSEWQIDRDLLQDRNFDFSRKFLPDGLSRVDTLPFLTAEDARLLSQIQGRTYAYIFGLVERFISAKMLDQGRAHALDDQHALEALVRFTNDEIKHQELFRRVEMMIGEQMPMGYRQMANPERRGARGARGEHLVGAGAHLPHRVVCPVALRREHRQDRGPVPAVQGRVHVPLEG